ncbi:hypothetical protein KFL_008720040 [Klebsormidium nitens]|uniref:CCHC-type domain-containing protein n=1 Tax=Klebsormidium nitens TaxID=105231 RepID=A0A1Y1IQX4_KLENI|nr:hypothetical protein KFL_008720040 [Klebsormidium nitens]|eukprot:GAQ91869.1 hypothetical protein KFL_008720040 [Klebsormidium nitens]
MSLDMAQPKLMQREQRLQGESKPPPAESADVGQASAFVAKHMHYGSSRGSKGSSREHGGSSESDSRSCYRCGETGHIKMNCKHRNADCENCGKRGHLKAVCRQPAGRAERAYTVKEGADVRGVAFTAWQGSAGAQTGVWLVDSGSTQHITGDRSKFVSYTKLGQPEVIEGIGGEPLTAVEVGVVELQCMNPKRSGHRDVVRAKPVEGVWVFDEPPRYSMDGAKKAPAAAQKKAQAESVKEKREELVEIELEFDEAGEEAQAEKAKNGATGEPIAKTPANKATGKKRGTGAAATEAVEIDEIDLRGSNSENEKTPEKNDKRRYPERVRKPATWLEAAKGTGSAEKG